MFTTRKLIFSFSLVMAVIAAMSTSAAADESGTQGTEKQSMQKSKEHSKAKTSSRKQAADMKAATDFSTDVDINSLLIQEFISHYEQKLSPPRAITKLDEVFMENNAEYRKQLANEAANGALASFATCKPFLYAQKNFPVANINRAHHYDESQPAVTVITLKQALDKATPGIVSVSTGVIINMDKNYPAVSDYAKCRIEAHWWITSAAMHLAQESRVFQSEEDAKVEIDRIFDVMDSSTDLFLRIQEKTNQVFDNAVCMGTMSFYNDANKSLSLNCGTFVSDASSNQLKFVVNGRETLSSNGIDGKKFKIAMSQSAGNSQSDSIDFSESDKTSKSAATGRAATVLSK
jgi:hypothetical protein